MNISYSNNTYIFHLYPSRLFRRNFTKYSTNVYPCPSFFSPVTLCFGSDVPYFGIGFYFTNEQYQNQFNIEVFFPNFLHYFCVCGEMTLVCTEQHATTVMRDRKCLYGTAAVPWGSAGHDRPQVDAASPRVPYA